MRLLPLAALVLPLSVLAYAQGAQAGGSVMHPFDLNGYELSGAEYWSFMGDTPFHYPDDVLWGFYPGDAADLAVGCAHQAYDRLHGLFQADPWRLRQVITLGATPRFYLWVNDYSRASYARARREPRLWHWDSGPDDYASGYWKWEATLTQDGACQLPSDAQIDQALDEALRALGGEPR